MTPTHVWSSSVRQLSLGGLVCLRISLRIHHNWVALVTCKITYRPRAMGTNATSVVRSVSWSIR